ncbi:precorrin-3B C(17)-methyltransferase [Synechococcales cyanobacterium C]|uniref:Precorrin-3B C(17)-methyltransferase n=1 Tax=Petrachloros mirabilis ULC683 TaxID=2781853 RepID=A0A8K2A819_9CYAN|nr:precorrin-3B C(17)-methyltransferase [Petrachloros mirabilis]NCJ06774.1 precorrin-3B C(17)-methyltransferase [Petrachloros mirabilis ULC683]
MSVAIIALNQTGADFARTVMPSIPDSLLYGLEGRTEDVDIPFQDFGETLRQLFQAGTPIIGVCAAGILIRTLASVLTNKWQEPPVLAIAEDGSAVVPLLGGLQGANDLARHLAALLNIEPAITTPGELRFRAALLSPPAGYTLVNPEDAKTFLSNLLAGESVKLIGTAPWLQQSQLPLTETGSLTIEVTEQDPTTSPSPEHLVYRFHPQAAKTGHLAIVGTGPGAMEWMSPEVQRVLRSATDWVGYKTYLKLVEPLRPSHTICHRSDNRVERDRAHLALNLAAQGRSVAVISSGDPGIFAMAAAVFEILEQEANPAWEQISIQVCPGISAMQAAAAQVGAPLGHDFCVISLSDILKPWSVIAQRLTAAAQADFAIAIYNPVSKQRTWQLQQAKDLLLQWRAPETPLILAQSVGRSAQAIIVKTLAQLSVEDTDMRTVILIGSSQTRTLARQDGTPWVYTPRSYPFS